jgi:hypothetical protein
MTRCGAVYVVLAEDPALDRLERCTRDPTWSSGTHCAEHEQQLAWVRASFPRMVAYQRQVADYNAAQQRAAAAEELSLL